MLLASVFEVCKHLGANNKDFEFEGGASVRDERTAEKMGGARAGTRRIAVRGPTVLQSGNVQVPFVRRMHTETLHVRRETGLQGSIG